MSSGPGRVRRPANGSQLAWTVAVVATAMVTVSCGRSDPVAEGADVDRPEEASMATVRFTDVAADVGLDVGRSPFRWGVGADPMAMMAGGLCWIDYDRDGWLDLFVTDTWSDGEWGRWRAEGAIPTSRLFRNSAGRFTDVTVEVGAGVENRSNGCVVADLDADGWSDLYVTTERDNVLLWNDGGTRFVDDRDLDHPSGAALYGWHSGAAVADFDGDGRLDLYVAGYTDLDFPKTETTKPGFPNPFVAVPDALLLNDGPTDDGGRATFRDVADAVGIEPDGPEYGLGVVVSDLDLDGDPDVHVANDTTPNQLYEYEQVEEFPGFRLVERGLAAGVGDDGAGMGVAAADVDGDGRPDLVATNQLAERHVLALNRSNGELDFHDARAELGVPRLGAGQTGWGVSWGDVDLDGDVDLVIGNGAVPITDVESDRQPVVVLENRREGDGRRELVDAAATVGVDELGPYVARGVAMADYDNDGDLDIAVATIGGPLALLRNTGAGGNWLVVAPEAPAPGAIVTAELADGRRLVRELQAGSSYLSSEDPRAHFGLGTVSEVERVTVSRAGKVLLDLTDVEANQVVPVVLGDR